MKWLFAPLSSRWQCVLLTAGTYFLLTSFLFILPVTEAQKCTTKVKIEKPPTTVPRTKRIPAKCSNWDRSWSWITKMDCGTKYVLDYVDLPKHQQYRMVYICCPGESDCKSAALEESDERFLAITFGCASAALVILIIIIVVSVCRRKNYRFAFCKFGHQYETTDDQEPPVGCNGDRICQNEYVCDDLKLVESEYEEICDIHSTEWNSAKEKLLWEEKSTANLIKDSDILQDAPTCTSDGALKLLDLDDSRQSEGNDDLDSSLTEPKHHATQEQNDNQVSNRTDDDTLIPKSMMDPGNGSKDVSHPVGGSKDIIEPVGGSTDVIDSVDGSTDVIHPVNGSKDMIHPVGGSEDILELVNTEDSDIAVTNCDAENPKSSLDCEERYKDLDEIIDNGQKEHSYEKINPAMQQSDEERYETLKHSNDSEFAQNGYTNVA